MMLTRNLIGLVAFVSYLGGPFFIADPLKPRIGSWPAVLITGLPLGAMLFGAYSMASAAIDRVRPSRRILLAGMVGMVITLGMHFYALWGLVRGLTGENTPLHVVGILAGLLWSLVYWRESRRWLPPDGGSASAVDASSPKPIEPS